MIANKLTPSSDPSESVAASNVVDGVALRAAFDNNAFPPGADWGTGLPAPGSTAQTQVLGVFQLLEDYADALSDVGVAEAVFQIMRGNFGRAGGLMDAISKGDRPPDPDVVVTPRGGLDLTHRVLLLVSGNPAISASWAGVPSTPRAVAEPRLNAWVSTLLPDPSAVRCDVTFHDGAGDHTAHIQLSDLGVGPLDCLAMADAADVPQRSEIEQRILLAAVPAGADSVSIDYHPAGAAARNDCVPRFLFPGEAGPLSHRWSAPAYDPGFDRAGEARGRPGRSHGSRRSAEPRDDSVRQSRRGYHHAADCSRRIARRSGSRSVGAPSDKPIRSLRIDSTDQHRPRSRRWRTRRHRCSRPCRPGAPKQPRSISPRRRRPMLLSVFQTIFGDIAVLPELTPPDLVSLQSAFAQSAALVASDTGAPGAMAPAADVMCVPRSRGSTWH